MSYQAGYLTARHDSDQVEGFGTYWLTYCKPGDTLTLAGTEYKIIAITDNHQLQLNAYFAGDDIIKGGYEIIGSTKPGEHYNWIIGEWVFDVVAARAVKAKELADSVALTLVSGVYCNILGSSHFYPTTEVDQINMARLNAQSLSNFDATGTNYYLWCSDTSGWVFQPHTKDQLNHFYHVYSNWIFRRRADYSALLTTLAAASTQADIDAITWDYYFDPIFPLFWINATIP